MFLVILLEKYNLKFYYVVYLVYIDLGIFCIWVLNILLIDMKFFWGNIILENVLKISIDFFVEYYVLVCRNYMICKVYFIYKIDVIDSVEIKRVWYGRKFV